MLPLLQEPYTTFLQNAHDLWFNQMGDGKTTFEYVTWKKKHFKWIPPDGCLMDAANDKKAAHRQGDGDPEIHDWAVEFSAAGALLQAEMLLISRNSQAINHYLPKLERCAGFLESRRDPDRNLFLGGPGANLLAPSFAGWHKDDNTYDKAYLTGLSITYSALLDRLIELEKMTDNSEKVQHYTQLKQQNLDGLEQMKTEEGYFIKSMDPDGTKHGVFGAEKYGYFEAVCNHDAMCFHISDEEQSHQIYKKIASIEGLRPHDLILTNYPSLDDLYEEDGLLEYGKWVNGGNWSTCEARMIMAYYRVGAYQDIQRSMRRMLAFARDFKMDNPYKDFGTTPWHDTTPITLCYDNFGPYAAMIRGLFEYIYQADGLTLIPHIPPTITKLQQKFPIQFGEKQIYLATEGSGSISHVTVNQDTYTNHDGTSVFLSYADIQAEAHIIIYLGDESLEKTPSDTVQINQISETSNLQELPDPTSAFWKESWFFDSQTEKDTEPPISMHRVQTKATQTHKFYSMLLNESLSHTYEGNHAKTALDMLQAFFARYNKLATSPETFVPKQEKNLSNQAYYRALLRLLDGLEGVMDTYENHDDPQKTKLYDCWKIS